MDRQVDEQVISVLRFMQANSQHRRMFWDLLEQDIQQWPKMEINAKRQAFERHTRRFRTVNPALAGKDRVLHAGEALRFAALASVQADDSHRNSWDTHRPALQPASKRVA